MGAVMTWTFTGATCHRRDTKVSSERVAEQPVSDRQDVTDPADSGQLAQPSDVIRPPSFWVNFRLGERRRR